MLPMMPWRIAGAVSLVALFAAAGLQIQRLVDDQPWSDGLMWLAILSAVATATCVLVWTWVATENARRLVGPATTVRPPDPVRNVVAWAPPFVFVAISAFVAAYVGSRIERGPDDPVSSVPLLIAAGALLVAVPLTYRPLHLLARAVRQVGGHSARLAQWMWVPVVLAVVGVASIVALRLVAVDDPGDEWVPLWVVGVVAIVPSVVVVVLGWRAAGSVEEAIGTAARLRLGSGPDVRARRARRLPTAPVQRDRVTLVPGADWLRLGIVTLIAGLALFSLVGAVIMFMFWLEGNDGVLTPGQSDRAWDAMASLHSGARLVAYAVLALVAVWTFVAVLNARLASGRPRNPLIAAVTWPAAAVAVWAIADRLVVDQPVGSVVVGFVLQSLVFWVPFAVLERSADAVGARRTPLRITYVFGVVLLVHVQGLGGLSTIEPTDDPAEYLRIAGYLGLGALVQLLATLAVTDACRSIERSTEHEAEHHNALVDQREALAAVRPTLPTTAGAG
jgi:hypothetical protein